MGRVKERQSGVLGLGLLVLVSFPIFFFGCCAVFSRPGAPVVGRVQSFDGVEIVYTMRGTGPTALVFVHGGLANRTFWSRQLSALSGRYRVVALDLAGHGESGRDRERWTLPAFGRDVARVVETLELERVVLIGNSLGGPVALEAARLLPGKVVGVVAVDTLHDLTRVADADQVRARADAFRLDFRGTCRALSAGLFHPGQWPELQAWAEERMASMNVAVVVGMMEGMGSYDSGAAARNAGVPLRAINGDLWPTEVEKNRSIIADFTVVIMEDTGHYPMMERPEEFDRHLVAIVEEF